MTRIAAAITEYAERFHRLIAGKHAVCSPAGAWLLLALVAESAEGATRDTLASSLGCDPAEAGAAARELLAHPHPAVSAAAAVWRDPHLASPGLDALSARITPPAESGPVPTQADADRWAAEHTHGLIDRFPLSLDDSTVLVLATALATRLRWASPFAPTTASTLAIPADPRFGSAELLRADDEMAGHWQGIVDRRFGVHCALSPDADVAVTSVVGAADDPAAALLAGAARIGAELTRQSFPTATSLFDLPLGDGVAWRITESRGTGEPERVHAVLPAWSAASNHRLLDDPDLGFAAAGDTLVALLPPGDWDVAAQQSAMARYTRTGFEAAAVTGLAVAVSAVVPRTRTIRSATIEFTRPYAVVATAIGPGPWAGIPLFSAWVQQP